MSQQIIAKRYAVALFELTKEQNSLDKVEAELQAVKEALQNNNKFLAVLAHPKVSRVKKKELFKEAFAGLSDSVMNTILLLVDRKREDIIIEVADYFQEIANDARGVAEATVFSVRALSNEEEKAISQVFAKFIGKETLKIRNVVDKTLIGGVKIRIGNTIYDGSIKRKLERIERQIVSAQS